MTKYVCLKHFDNLDHYDSDIGFGYDNGDNNHILIKMAAMMMMAMMLMASWQQCLESNWGRRVHNEQLNLLSCPSLI